jgi:hypothetical protein
MTTSPATTDFDQIADTYVAMWSAADGKVARVLGFLDRVPS